MNWIRCNLLSRIEEHAALKKSEICKHLLQHFVYCVDFNTSAILGGENDTVKLLLLKLLFIQEQIPDLNNNSKSSTLAIFII